MRVYPVFNLQCDRATVTDMTWVSLKPWPNGLASRRKTCVQSCVGWPNGEKLASTCVRIGAGPNSMIQVAALKSSQVDASPREWVVKQNASSKLSLSCVNSRVRLARAGRTYTVPSTLEWHTSLLSRQILEGCFYVSPHVRESGIRNPANFCCWNPESRGLESGIHNGLESGIHYGMDSEIQKVEIRNPEAGIRNPGPSWILLHGRYVCNGHMASLHLSLTFFYRDCFRLQCNTGGFAKFQPPIWKQDFYFLGLVCYWFP